MHTYIHFLLFPPQRGFLATIIIYKYYIEPITTRYLVQITILN